MAKKPSISDRELMDQFLEHLYAKVNVSDDEPTARYQRYAFTLGYLKSFLAFNMTPTLRKEIANRIRLT